MPQPLVHYADRTHTLGGKELDTGGSTTRECSKVTCPVCRAGGFGPVCFTCGGKMTGKVTGDRHCRHCRKLYKWESSYDYPSSPGSSRTALAVALAQLGGIVARAKR